LHYQVDEQKQRTASLEASLAVQESSLESTVAQLLETRNLLEGAQSEAQVEINKRAETEVQLLQCQTQLAQVRNTGTSETVCRWAIRQHNNLLSIGWKGLKENLATAKVRRCTLSK
jgi:uncharacterized coiled-coil protein SlyX